MAYKITVSGGKIHKTILRLGCKDMKMYPLVDKCSKRDMHSDGQMAGLSV